MREHPFGLAPDEARGRGPGRRAVVSAIPPEAVKKAFARQPVGLAHHEDGKLGLAARAVALAYRAKVATQRVDAARRDAQSKCASTSA